MDLDIDRWERERTETINRIYKFMYDIHIYVCLYMHSRICSISSVFLDHPD